jgi:hypothetical protein
MHATLVAGSWLVEVVTRQNDFSRRPHRRRLAISIALSLIALWQPVDPVSLRPALQPSCLLASGSSLTFCMLATMSLAAPVAYYPHVNPVTLRVNAVVGLLIGIGNLWLEFVQLPQLAWIGVLHLPLVAISAVALCLSFRPIS